MCFELPTPTAFEYSDRLSRVRDFCLARIAEPIAP
jgi:hypothetical protein